MGHFKWWPRNWLLAAWQQPRWPCPVLSFPLPLCAWLIISTSHHFHPSITFPLQQRVDQSLITQKLGTQMGHQTVICRQCLLWLLGQIPMVWCWPQWMLRGTAGHQSQCSLFEHGAVPLDEATSPWLSGPLGSVEHLWTCCHYNIGREDLLGAAGSRLAPEKAGRASDTQWGQHPLAALPCMYFIRSDCRPFIHNDTSSALTTHPL